MGQSYLKHFLIAAVPLFALTATTLRADTIVFSENFDSTAAVLGVTSAGQFTATGGTNVDVVGAADGWAALCTGPESGNCVDLGGTNGNAFGVISLTAPLNLAIGTYDLSFDLIGSGRGDATSTLVTFGSYSHIFNLASGDTTTGIVNQLVNITTAGPTQLTFTNLDTQDANVGAVLDNVLVTSPSPTPEPSSLMLLGTGILGMAAMLRRNTLVPQRAS